MGEVIVCVSVSVCTRVCVRARVCVCVCAGEGEFLFEGVVMDHISKQELVSFKWELKA